MKQATAHRTGYNAYSVRFGRRRRSGSYSFLLALSVGGWTVTVDQRDYRLPTEPTTYRLRNSFVVT